MNGGARIATEAAPGGRTRLRELHASAPLAAKRAAGAVHLIGSATSPLDGDRIEITLDVGAGSELTVHTVAATIAWPSRTPQGPSVMTIRARVGAGAVLRWEPEPLVPVAGCRHELRTEIELHPSARLVWREELVLGRHGEPPGGLRTHTRVLRGGVPLLHQELAIDRDGDAHRSPALVGRARAVGSLLVVGPGAPDHRDTVQTAQLRGAVLELEGGGRMATATATTVPALRDWLERQRVLLTGRGTWLHPGPDAAGPAAPRDAEVPTRWPR